MFFLPFFVRDTQKVATFVPMNGMKLPFENISIEHVSEVLERQSNLMSLMDLAGFFLCRKGWADVSINERTFRIQSGDIAFYTPSTFVSLLNRSADLDGIAVKCEIDFIIPLFERVLDGQSILAMREHPCISLNRQQLESVELMVAQMHDRQQWLMRTSAETQAHNILQHLLLSQAEALFYELLYDYASNSQSLVPKEQDSKDRIFQNFLVSLLRNYKREREVAFYAAQQYLSPRYFSSIIKEKSGHSALQWIIQMVISSARQILRSSDLSIKEIASDFNFPSQSFFGKYFKQYVGVSPKEYRQQARKQ